MGATYIDYPISQQDGLKITHALKNVISDFKKDNIYSDDFFKMLDKYIKEGVGLHFLQDLISYKLYKTLLDSGQLKEKIVCEGVSKTSGTIVLNIIYEMLTGEKDHFLNDDIEKIKSLQDFGKEVLGKGDINYPFFFYVIENYGIEIAKKILNNEGDFRLDNNSGGLNEEQAIELQILKIIFETKKYYTINSLNVLNQIANNDKLGMKIVQIILNEVSNKDYGKLKIENMIKLSRNDKFDLEFFEILAGSHSCSSILDRSDVLEKVVNDKKLGLEIAKKIAGNISGWKLLDNLPSLELVVQDEKLGFDIALELAGNNSYYFILTPQKIRQLGIVAQDEKLGMELAKKIAGNGIGNAFLDNIFYLRQLVANEKLGLEMAYMLLEHSSAYVIKYVDIMEEVVNDPEKLEMLKRIITGEIECSAIEHIEDFIKIEQDVNLGTDFVNRILLDTNGHHILKYLQGILELNECQKAELLPITDWYELMAKIEEELHVVNHSAINMTMYDALKRQGG